MTEYEHQVSHEKLKKKKYIGPMFKLHSGVASAIPLRKDGVVRMHGPYISSPEKIMYNRENPRLLEGPWRPGAANLPFSPIKKAHNLKPLKSI